MKVADLYIRVSTDEQAEKGYSQRNQEELLSRYCEINGIHVNSVIFEDHSAKTFNRPQWMKLLIERKKKSNQVDLILFTKWDRFSRNAGDAYQMISILRKLGIEPQAIEQPLDLSIPENKMMLAFYLAAPEVENDRRALNVFHGMRRARKEGRWMGAAPIGYQNKTGEDGRKFIAFREPEASIMKWAFEEIARGMLAPDQIRQTANKKGLKCGRSNFWYNVRNPVYCGKIFIAKYKDEESRLVLGLHQPLISEALYYDVQEILDGNKRKTRLNTKVVSPQNLPLRGFLKCPKCERMLTGSASKGRKHLYYYYHCIASCGCRFKAEFANEKFVDYLKCFKPYAGINTLYKTVISSAYKQKISEQQFGTKQVVEEINKQNEKLVKARELVLSGEIDPIDYRSIKASCEESINRLEAKLTEATSNVNSINIDKMLEKVLTNLSNIDTIYREADTSRKREIVGSIFSEKLCFDGDIYRTTNMNEVTQLIYHVNNELGIKKTGK